MSNAVLPAGWNVQTNAPPPPPRTRSAGAGRKSPVLDALREHLKEPGTCITIPVETPEGQRPLEAAQKKARALYSTMSRKGKDGKPNAVNFRFKIAVLPADDNPANKVIRVWRLSDTPQLSQDNTNTPGS